jgi:hypothetical protein
MWLWLIAGCMNVHEQTPFHQSSNWVETMSIAKTWSTIPNNSWRYVMTTSHSMAPALQGGEITLLIDYQPGMPLKRGQMVIFDRGDFPNVLHRVWSFNGSAAYISGDNNRYSDGWIPVSQIKYVVVRVIVTAPPAPIVTARIDPPRLSPQAITRPTELLPIPRALIQE